MKKSILAVLVLLFSTNSFALELNGAERNTDRKTREVASVAANTQTTTETKTAEDVTTEDTASFKHAPERLGVIGSRRN